MATTVSLAKCKCKHLDIEHRLVLNEFFEPIGTGACNVCLESVCPQFNLPGDAPESVDPASALKDADPRDYGRAEMLQQMINDDEYYANVRKVVAVARINFLSEYYEELLKEDVLNHEEIRDTSDLLVESFEELERLDDAADKETRKQRKRAKRVCKWSSRWARFLLKFRR